MTLDVRIRARSPIAIDLAFRVEPGELLALVGHSGSGKSTTLRAIAGLWRAAESRIAVNGTVWEDSDRGLRLPPHRRRLGMVFQSYALFPHMSAEANVMAAMVHRPGPERAAEARRLLGLVNLAGMEGRRPAELSGGQQQRVAVARALAREPQALLLDEPFSAVDRATRETLYREIRGLRRVLNMPVVLVTHDLEEAQLLADRMVVIEAGRVIRSGSTAEVMFDPAALRSLGLAEAGASLPARVAAHEDDMLTRLETSAGPLWVPHVEAPPGASVRVRIMAHEVILSLAPPEGLSALNVLPAVVTDLAAGEGGGIFVRLQLGHDRILARITARSAAALALATGTACFAILKSMSVARDNVGATAEPAA
ncbi:molybdenum ABC transporter ATP-binding protein (plasmid) [Cereibacter azotoformans]|uniref:molybdenum ABC transporter ATP-binding protein n=1 Tax=Cereibacter azotoformans TaxID=43057 RepID=UPI001EEC98CE|nr:molybdenum ABC transporter ATP-binding protein [Cereibacter azotoformans]ULB12454.1 molybdenum ABC transporter ATP-binding protein [Cereibacter azotoformans]